MQLRLGQYIEMKWAIMRMTFISKKGCGNDVEQAAYVFTIHT
jgi:hypothetical protein